MHLGKMLKEAMRDIMRWANSDDQYATECAPSMKSAYPISAPGSSGSTTDSNREMHFTITNATGGKIIKVSWYDYKLSREYINLHIITDQEDLAEELSQIITRESLHR